jgi:hypothetical protein
MKWKVNIVLNHWKEKHLRGQNKYVRSREVIIQITEGWEFMYKW